MAVAVPRPELPAGYQVEAIGVLGENESWWKNPSTRKDERMPERAFVLLNFSLDGLSYPMSWTRKLQFDVKLMLETPKGWRNL